MGRRVRLGSALVAGTLAFVVVGTSTAHAILSTSRYKCQTAIANEGGKYVKGKLKLIQKCKETRISRHRAVAWRPMPRHSRSWTTS